MSNMISDKTSSRSCTHHAMMMMMMLLSPTTRDFQYVKCAKNHLDILWRKRKWITNFALFYAQLQTVLNLRTYDHMSSCLGKTTTFIKLRQLEKKSPEIFYYDSKFLSARVSICLKNWLQHPKMRSFIDRGTSFHCLMIDSCDKWCYFLVDEHLHQ